LDCVIVFLFWVEFQVWSKRPISPAITLSLSQRVVNRNRSHECLLKIGKGERLEPAGALRLNGWNGATREERLERAAVFSKRLNGWNDWNHWNIPSDRLLEL
jgi:hypothetical protein